MPIRTLLGSLLLTMACNSGTEIKIETTNSPPTVTILSPGDGSVFDEYSVIYFQAKVSDTYDSPDELTVFWSSDIQGDLKSTAVPTHEGDLLFSTGDLAPEDQLWPGVHEITLTVTDTDGGQTQASLGLEIIDQPEAPVITILQPTDGDFAIENTPFTVMAEIWDARDDVTTLPVFIESNLFGSICQTNAAENGMAECPATLPEGIHVLTFTVNNTSGFTATQQASLEVISGDDIDDDGDGYTENQGDCSDTDSSMYPGAAEVENNIDDNCNGVVDEGTNAYDDDGDGFSENQGDCNDTTIAVSPVAIEVCGNGIDDNCNGNQNEPNSVNCTTYYRDADGDNYGDASFTECWCQPGGTTGEFNVTNASDCFDGNPDAKPGQTAYFATHRGDGSFNYDCSVDSNGNETIQKEYLAIGSCNGWLASVGDCTMNTAGWGGGVPNCGVSAPFIHDNDSCSADYWLGIPVGCDIGGPSYTNETQRCR